MKHSESNVAVRDQVLDIGPIAQSEPSMNASLGNSLAQRRSPVA
jgi:hypothetical protein